MTGRELVLYILENGLEEEEVIDANGNPAGMMSPEEAAEKFEVSVSTVMAWLATGKIESFYISGTHYIPQSAQNPYKWMTQKKSRVIGPVMEATPSQRLINAMGEMNHEDE